MKTKFNFTISGLIIALIVVSTAAIGFAMFISDFEQNYNVTGNTSLHRYNLTQDIKEEAEGIRTATKLDPARPSDDGFFDIVGAFFSGGWKALKITGKSIDLFVGSGGLMEEAAKDVPILSFFKDNIIAIILIGVFLAVFIGALLKWKV